MNAQNDDRKVIPIESHPEWWGRKHNIRLPQRGEEPRVWCIGVGMVTVETPNPEPPTAA